MDVRKNYMYSKKNIISALKKLGLKKGDNVLIKSDLRYLGPYENHKKMLSMLKTLKYTSPIGYHEKVHLIAICIKL